MTRKIPALPLLAAGVLLSAGAGYGTAVLTHRAPAAGPASCHVQAVPGWQHAAVVPSGDAGWFWVPQLAAYQQFVCTDGSLVNVTSYGNSRQLQPIPGEGNPPAIYNLPTPRASVTR